MNTRLYDSLSNFTDCQVQLSSLFSAILCPDGPYYLAIGSLESLKYGFQAGSKVTTQMKLPDVKFNNLNIDEYISIVGN